MNARFRGQSLVVLAGIGGLLVVGCGPNTDPDTTVLRSGDTYLLKETEEYTGDVAGMGAGGELALVNGCIGIRSAEPRLIVFPPSAQIAGDGEDVVIAVDGVELRIGDRFESGTRGGFDGDPLSAFGDLATQAPEQCRDILAIQMDGFG